jgi:hypothetical protein
MKPFYNSPKMVAMKTEPKTEFQPLVKPGKFYALRVWIFLMRLRIADAIRWKKRLQWFHRRFRVRYLDGSPWHGLAKFSSSTAVNIIFASGKRRSAFAELHDASPGKADEIIAEAYNGLTARKIARKLGYVEPPWKNPIPFEDFYFTAICEAVEIYSPKP